jgi:uncharacterized Tic20 family protein
MACISHLAIFVSSIGLIVAIGLWIYLRNKQPYAAFQAAQAVLYQLVVLILTFINIHHYFTDGVIWHISNPEVRKELFAHRRELVLWTGWALLLGAVHLPEQFGAPAGTAVRTRLHARGGG